LVNTRGEVIGLNTLKVIRKNVTGIGFALSSSDLLTLLRRLYPDLALPYGATTARGSEAASDSADLAAPLSPAVSEPTTSFAPSPQATPSPDGFGTITITSEPDAAEIFLDGKFHGHTPATLKLPAGSPTVLLRSPGYSDDSRTFELPKSSKLTLKAVFQTPPSPGRPHDMAAPRHGGPASLPRPCCCASIGSLRRADQGFFDSPSPRFPGPR
jgi:hypothetical protein